MAGLLETAAAVAITGAMLASTSASMAASARIASAAAALTGELFVERQLEHLLDRGALAGGAGPDRPPAVGEAGTERIVFHADHDGDGRIDTDSSEVTALELVHHDGAVRIRHRLGRQSMTIFERKDARARLAVFDRFGNAAGAAAASLLTLEIVRSVEPPRRWTVAIAAASS